MKKTDISRHRWTLVIGIFAVVLSATGGRLKGISDARGDSLGKTPSHGPGRQSDSTTAGAGETRKPAGGAPALSTEKIHQRLWKIWKETPHPDYDPEARAEISRLIATMSSAQIEGVLKTLPPGAELGAEWKLRRLILSSWVLQDGPAALAYMETAADSRTTMNRMETSNLVMQWTGDQPDAAFAWMNDETLPPEQKSRAANIRLNSLMTLMDTDPDRALQELSRMGQEDVSRQLRFWAGTHGNKPEARAKLLDHVNRTGSPGDIAQVRSTVVRVMAEDDPAAARELMDSWGPDPGGREALELSITLGRAKKEPQAAFDEWLEKADVSGGIPESIILGIGSWMWPEPDQAAKWLDARPPGEKRDALYAGTVPALAGFQHFDKAARIAAAIGSPDLRASALQGLDLRWSLVNREAADKWKQTLTPEDRELMGK